MNSDMHSTCQVNLPIWKILSKVVHNVSKAFYTSWYIYLKHNMKFPIMKMQNQRNKMKNYYGDLFRYIPHEN